ncbi:MAG: flavin reductase family protein [Thermoplasmata archaeon]
MPTEVLVSEYSRIDPRRYRTALGRFPTGVTIITAKSDHGEYAGVTCNSFNSLSLDPPLVLWSLDRAARSRPTFERAEMFGVNVLSVEQRELAVRFATPSPNKFEGVAFREGLEEIPVFPGSAAVLKCRRRSVAPEGDHLLFVGEVVYYSWDPERRPLLYADGHYGAVAGEPTSSG